VCGRFIPQMAARIAAPAILVGKWLLPVAGVAILVAEHHALGALLGDGTLFAMILFVGVALAVGHWLGGPGNETREVLAVSTACRHPGIALALTSSNDLNQGHEVTAAILLYLLVSIIATIPYTKWQAKRIAAAAQRA
jgi:bile acid:Na+ symporter, BASS family